MKIAEIKNIETKELVEKLESAVDALNLFGTKLCGQHQSGPENGVNNRPFCHRIFNMEKTG